MADDLAEQGEAVALSVELPVPVELAWQLISDNGHIARWWGDYATLEAKADGAFRETWNNGSREVITSGRVLVFEPLSLLVLSWADDDWPGSTTVSLDLAATAQGCSLQLAHDGWQVHPVGLRARLMADHAAGWQHHLDSLAAYAAGLGSR